MMSKLLKLHVTGASLKGAALAVSAVILTGCVVQARVAVPAPPAVYVEPAVVDVQVREAPPPLPDYEQPPCPEDGYLWTPGYWAWGVGDYYWVPGTWVQPPRVGVLWTPGYWGFVGGVYAFHAGYWGPHVGFYGGVNYGFGYVGTGFAGGVWVGHSFSYNRAVTNINVTVVHNTYNTTVNSVAVNKVSYNGGAGGTAAAPTAQERQFAQEQRLPATPMQQQHMQQAVRNPALAARTNGGHPSIAATPRPAAFNAPGVVHARGASVAEGTRPAQPSVEPRPQFAQPLSRPATEAQAATETPAVSQKTSSKPKPGPKQKQKKGKPQPQKNQDKKEKKDEGN
jgi:hypothetical protein